MQSTFTSNQVRGLAGWLLLTVHGRSWLFFGWRRGALAFADILVLWLLIVATLIGFWRVKPLAGRLLAPCLVWVSFATALNFAAWRMNPQALG